MALPKYEVVGEVPTTETDPQLKDSWQRWWLLVLLFFGMLISYVHRGAFNVSLLDYIDVVESTIPR